METAGGGTGDAVRLTAPAKLTLGLRVLSRRPDGYHDIEAHMVAIDLADELLLDPGGRGLELRAGSGTRAMGVPTGEENLVLRALRAVGRTAGVSLLKRIPVRGGLGGGSSDAAAVLRWAGCLDPAVAAGLGADVPFCVAGGQALVSGFGEVVTPLEYHERRFVLLVPPFGVDTGAVYRAWDYLAGDRPAGPSGPSGPSGPDGAGADDGGPDGAGPATNDLTAAALAVEPRLARWRDVLGEATGLTPVLAGSGSTWYVEGRASAVGLAGRRSLSLGGDDGLLIAVRTVPAGWSAGP